MRNTTRLLRLRTQAVRIPRSRSPIPLNNNNLGRPLHTTSLHHDPLPSTPKAVVELASIPGNATPLLSKSSPGLGIDQVPVDDIQGPVTPLTRYEQLVKAGALREDAHQRGIIGKLEKLHEQLRDYHPPPVPSSSSSGSGSGSNWFSGLFGGSSSSSKHAIIPPESVPKGMYLYGDVGCGKTMLMDLFYSTLPSHLVPQGRRIHFHAFMLDVFRRVHAIKHGLPTKGTGEGSTEKGLDAGELKREIKSHIPLAKERIRKQRAFDPMEGRSDERAVGVEALSGAKLFGFDRLFSSSSSSKNRGGTMVAEEDAIYEAAREMVEEGRILCFDEFQVTDIVTAMILRQLLGRMMDYGMVCVITSNRHPDELYKNGLQRGSFEPCIDMIKNKFEVVDLDSKTDYRKIPKALSKVYFHPLNEEVRGEMSKLFASQTAADPTSPPNPVIENRELSVWGRKLFIPESTSKVARFPFEKLCGEPLSSADYLEITGAFEVIFIEDMPELGIDRKDQARRFITFIDACYENKTRLYISSEVPIFEVFGGDREKSADEVSAHMRSIMDDLGLAHDVVKSSAMFSGDEEFFAWARCVSRLTQMGTRDWANNGRVQ